MALRLVVPMSKSRTGIVAIYDDNNRYVGDLKRDRQVRNCYTFVPSALGESLGFRSWYGGGIRDLLNSVERLRGE